MFIVRSTRPRRRHKWLSKIGSTPGITVSISTKFLGVAFVYMYFQIPLMILIITPASPVSRSPWVRPGIWPSSWRYWRHVGIYRARTAVLGGMFLLFGSGFSATRR